jgi:hypothetical protein
MGMLFWIIGFMFTVGFVLESEGELSKKEQIIFVFGCFGLWPLMLGAWVAKRVGDTQKEE